MKLVAKTYSNYLEATLRSHNSFTIHSIFNNGFNITNGEELIFIGNKKNGINPFHIVIEDYQPINIQLNEKVLINNFIVKTTNCQINILTQPHNNLILKQKLPNLSYLKANIQKILEINKNNGFGYTISQFINNEQFAEFFLPFINYQDNDELISSIKYFIGRGNGLTPSGDDLLLGLIFIEQLFMEDNLLTKQIATVSSEKEYTTMVSYQYLSCAFKGYFNSELINLASSLKENKDIDNNLLMIMKHGSTSGIDLLLGIIIGMNVLERRLYE